MKDKLNFLIRLPKMQTMLVMLVPLVVAGFFARPLIAWFTLKPLGGRSGAESTTTAGAIAFKVALQPDPPRQTGNALLITLSGADGSPIEGADVKLTYLMPAMGAMPEMRGEADVREGGQGRYRASFDLPMGGSWMLELVAASPRGKATARYNMTVGNRGLVPVGAEENAGAPTAPAPLTPAMVNRLRAVLSAYEDVRTELAADRLEGVKAKAPSLERALQDAGDPGDLGLTNCVQAGAEDARKLRTANSIEEARKSFATLSQMLVPLAASDKRLSEGFHLFTCPMTSGFNQWLQRSDSTSNPYLGLAMPDCGTPTEWDKALVHDMKVSQADGVAYYTCSMHPNVRHVSPDSCPICSMNLVAVSKKEVASGVIRVTEQRRQEIGVRTATVEMRPLRLAIRAVGRTAYDESRVRDVTLKMKGWIETLYVNETGQPVRRGQPLLALYSPDLYAAQEEYLLALRSQSAAKATGAPDRADYLVRAARQRLKLWNLSDAQIDRVAAFGKPIERMPILSPYNGFIIEKDVFEGAAVEAGQRLFRVADLDRIWVEADVYESDLPQLAVGQPVRVGFPYVPGRKLEGRIAFIYPYLNQQTRTGRVRIELPNPNLELKPEMYADVTLELDRGPRLVIPVSAVVETGPRRVVFLDLGEGRLKPQNVEVGLRNGDDYEVLSGVNEGDRIVTSANFLISAESRIRSAESFWGGSDAK